MSSEFFQNVMNDVLFFTNEELDKLRVKRIRKEDMTIFFKEASFGFQLDIKLRKSRKKILNDRLVKIAMRIQEKYSVPGFSLIC